jgi:hypothetical protein
MTKLVDGKKHCYFCDEYFSIDSDHWIKSPNKTYKCGYQLQCKIARKYYRKNWYEKNKEYENKKSIDYYCQHPEARLKQKTSHDKWVKENADYLKEKRKKDYYKNQEENISKALKWKRENRGRVNRQERKRRETDINYRIKSNMRSRVVKAVRLGLKSGSAVRDLGCSIDEFKLYIAKQFAEGMSWDNWGHDTWHLDHIIPVSVFDLTKREEFLKAFHYTNYHPMWANENYSKGDDVVGIDKDGKVISDIDNKNNCLYFNEILGDIIVAVRSGKTNERDLVEYLRSYVDRNKPKVGSFYGDILNYKLSKMNYDSIVKYLIKSYK